MGLALDLQLHWWWLSHGLSSSANTSLVLVLKIQYVVFCKLHALYIHTLHGHIDPDIYIIIQNCVP